jgi:hypothetical protein
MDGFQTAEQLLAQARALREAYPGGSDLPVADLPDGDPELVAALRYLRDEMLLARDGRAGSLAVLDDEAAHVRRVLGAVGVAGRWQARRPVSD